MEELILLDLALQVYMYHFQPVPDSEEQFTCSITMELLQEDGPPTIYILVRLPMQMEMVKKISLDLVLPQHTFPYRIALPLLYLHL